MTKVLFCVITIFLGLHASGQTEEGAKLVGGTMFLKTQGKNVDFSFNPNFGYFVNKYFCVGAYAEINSFKYEVDNIRNTQYSIGPLARLYVSSNVVSLFTEFKTSYGIIRTSFLDDYGISRTTKGNSFVVKPGVGINYFITKNISFEALCSYYWMQTTYEIDNSPYNDNIKFNDHGLNLYFGIQVFLTKSEKQHE